MAEYGFAIIHNPSNKLAENLDMCETCVNTHTHTFSPDVSRARQYTLLLLCVVINVLKSVKSAGAAFLME